MGIKIAHLLGTTLLSLVLSFSLQSLQQHCAIGKSLYLVLSLWPLLDILADNFLILVSSGLLRWSLFSNPKVGVTRPDASLTCSPFTGILQH